MPLQQPGTTPRNWYAVRVRPKSELAVANELQHRKFLCFSPVYSTERQWSGKTQDLALPLFPGHVFCAFPSASEIPETVLLSLDGVRGLVLRGGAPAAADPLELDQIDTATRSGYPVQPWPYMSGGQRVSIGRGPLKGLTGFLIAPATLVISLTLLQRSVAVLFEAPDLEAPTTPGMARGASA